MLPLMLGFFAIMYFFMIRPQQKEEKRRKEMLAALVEGQRAVTTGGIHGVIGRVDEETIQLRVGERTMLTVDRQHVARLLGDEKADASS